MPQPREEQNFWNWTAICEELAADPTMATKTFSKFGVTYDSLHSCCLLPQGPEPYGRRILYRSATHEVMLATWAKGAECAPHDHGWSTGIVWLVSGRFMESEYTFDGGLTLTDSKPLSRSMSVMRVDHSDIHSMRSLDQGISLHIYSPPIVQMKVYDQANRRVITVSDDCGAWIPADKKYILDIRPWHQIDQTPISI